MTKNKLVVVLLLMAVTAWATVGAATQNLAAKMQKFIPVEINAQGMPLENLLALLSEHSGIHIVAVPEVAGLKVDLRMPAGQKLEQVMAALNTKYALTYSMHDAKNAIIVYQGTNSEMLRMPAIPAVKAADTMRYRLAFPQSVHGVPASFNTEEYKQNYDNRYQHAVQTPVSTFSIDVDTAAYSNVRRYINSGKLPPADAARTEEMINYFTYDYPQPIGEQPFSVTTEVHDCPWQPQHKLVMIGLQGKNIPLANLPPSNLVFLIDVSGSMDEPQKLPLLKTAFKMLVKQLRAQDKVAIVVYAGSAGVVLEPTPGSAKAQIIKAIDNLTAGGSTAGGEGIKLAYKLAKEHLIKGGNNRVILATDGDFNVGITSEGELTKLIEERRHDGIFLSVLGFGMGNLKDNKMELLADKGNGNYAYIDNALEAEKVLVGQMAGTLYTIAKDVKLQVEFNPAKVKYYRLVGYENRVMENQDFNDDRKDAGDMGAGHAVTAFYEIIPAGSDETPGTTDPLRYQRPPVLVPSDDLLQVKIRYKKPDDNKSMLLTERISSREIYGTPSENFRFAAAVAEYALLLRNSEFKGQAAYAHVLKTAVSAKGADADGYRAELIKLVEISQLLDDRHK